MRENGGGMPRDPNDVLCGREIDPHFLTQLNHTISRALRDTNAHMPLHEHNLLSNQLHDVYNLIGSIPHLRFHDLPRFTVDRLALNLRPRKAFVSNAITLTRFKQTIRRNHLLAIKNENIAQILQAVIQAVTDIAFRFQHSLSHTTPIQSHNVASFHNELSNLKTYANQELAIIHNDFHSSTLQRVFFSAQSKHFKLIH
jgi:hypothetical protein